MCHVNIGTDPEIIKASIALPAHPVVGMQLYLTSVTACERSLIGSTQTQALTVATKELSTSILMIPVFHMTEVV